MIADRFRARFGTTPRVYRAPGRVNLIGEHTDYNDGFVLPAALSASCWVAAAPRRDRACVVFSEQMNEEVTWDLDDTGARPTRQWSDYARGVIVTLQSTFGGGALQAASLLVNSDVPLGAGLSSSAAFETSVALALIDLSGLSVGRTELARLCQRAENEFVGARCGIMDQFVACEAREGHALLLDCRSLEHRAVAMPSRVRLVACNTMVRHQIASGEYNRRRAECEAGVAVLASRVHDMRSLRDVDLPTLERHRDALPDVVFRRCRHVITENARVLRFADALERGDLLACGALMAQSHASLRDDYEVSCAELDLMVRLAGGLPSVHGARMTGGGFGGCTVNLVDAGAVEEFRRCMASRYLAETGREPAIYVSGVGGRAARVE